ncbi:hypothetical protein BDY19DRAFT_307190 [Irpex rosettiformis]|uniref:Uncharacterized protein n=1 Tax=Irpex rosettiformis TaxID=378272 RepID=A0ACB8TYL8_9APHY|nr:hypothetical protein BDY19DRAFT_307190 [Irpex rosettiformis]
MARYEACLADYRRLNDEVRRLKHMPMSGLSRPSEARSTPSVERAPEPMAVVEENDTPDLPPSPEQEPFVLSPIPPLASLPLSKNPHRQIFRPLTAEESDVEDLKSMKPNPYLLRSIDPISIKPSVHRMNSNSSLLSRNDPESAFSRSIPRSSVDVHMASCSSSPNTPQHISRERDDPMIFNDGSRPRRLSGDRNKASTTFNSQPCDTETQHDRWRAQLHDILETPQLSKLDSLLRSPESPAGRRRVSPEPSAPVTRTTSPTSSASSSASSQHIQSSGLLRPPLSRASTAAMQAERELRARSNSLKETSTSSTSSSALRDRDTYSYSQPPAPQPSSTPNNYYPRRGSIGNSSMRARPTAPTQPSGLTRSMWGMQDPPRVS